MHSRVSRGERSNHDVLNGPRRQILRVLRKLDLSAQVIVEWNISNGVLLGAHKLPVFVIIVAQTGSTERQTLAKFSPRMQMYRKRASNSTARRGSNSCINLPEAIAANLGNGVQSGVLLDFCFVQSDTFVLFVLFQVRALFLFCFNVARPTLCLLFQAPWTCQRSRETDPPWRPGNSKFRRRQGVGSLYQEPAKPPPTPSILPALVLGPYGGRDLETTVRHTFGSRQTSTFSTYGSATRDGRFVLVARCGNILVQNIVEYLPCRFHSQRESQGGPAGNARSYWCRDRANLCLRNGRIRLPPPDGRLWWNWSFLRKRHREGSVEPSVEFPCR